MLILRIPKPRSHKVWQDKAMNRDQVIRAAGVVSVSLFGSTARGESDPGDVFEQHLSQLLGCKVDAVEEPVRIERFQKEIDKDRALAFCHRRDPASGFTLHG